MAKKINHDKQGKDSEQFEQEPMGGRLPIEERHELPYEKKEAEKLFEQVLEIEKVYQTYAEASAGADKAHSHRTFDRTKKIEGIVSDPQTAHTGYIYELFSTRPGMYAHVVAISYRPRPKRGTITSPQNFFDIQGFRLHISVWRRDESTIWRDEVSLLLNTNNVNEAKELRNIVAVEIDAHPDMDARMIVQKYMIDITEHDTKQPEIIIE